MPLFPPPIPPPFTLETADITVLTPTAIVAGQAFFSSYVLNTAVTVTQMRCNLTGSPTGNIDMGIYDATGANGSPNNLLAHTGAIASATGAFTKSLTANLSLAPSQYWLAFLDTVADTVQLRGGVTGLGVLMKTSATNLTVLPSVAGTVVNGTTRIGMTALLLSSWS
jgi:hypothetical protein